METITNQLSLHLRDRASELMKLKEAGLKIIGYVPGGYLSDELVPSSGPIPFGLAVRVRSQQLSDFVLGIFTKFAIDGRFKALRYANQVLLGTRNH